MLTNHKAFRILNRPYPISTSGKEIVASSFIVAILSYFFLAIYQPFGTIYLSARYKYLLLAPYSIMFPAILTLANFLLIKRAVNWSISKEIAKILVTLVLGTACNYVYNITVINHIPVSISHMLWMFFYTATLALPILLIYLLIRYVYLTHISTTEIIVQPPAQEISIAKRITIQAETGTDTLQMNEDDFLFAESQGNYCNVVYLDGGAPARQLMRISLKNLQEQIDSAQIIRCHRSYIINTAKIISAKGNAQGYKLSVSGFDATVPVSRSFIPMVQNILNQVTE
jgi:hypothetical protein